MQLNQLVELGEAVAAAQAALAPYLDKNDESDAG